MHRLSILVATLALVAAACGGGDGDSATTTTAAATSTTAAATTTTAAATTTTAAPATTAATTTTAAPTTTVDPAEAARAARIAAAAALAGTWTGEWRNLTFGSDGPVEIEVEVDVEAAFALIRFDLGGNVFGAADPDPAVIEFDLVLAPPYSTRDSIFGEVETSINDDGTFTMTAANVPDDFIASMVVEGIITPTSITGQYTIEFAGGGDPAVGEIEVTKG